MEGRAEPMGTPRPSLGETVDEGHWDGGRPGHSGGDAYLARSVLAGSVGQ